eukprot:403339227
MKKLIYIYVLTIRLQAQNLKGNQHRFKQSILNLIGDGFFPVEFLDQLMEKTKVFISDEYQQLYEQEYKIIKKICIEQKQWRLNLSTQSQIVDDQGELNKSHFHDQVYCLYPIKESNSYSHEQLEDWNKFKIINTYKDILVLQQINDETKIKIIGRWSYKIAKDNTEILQIQNWKLNLQKGTKLLVFETQKFQESIVIDIVLSEETKNQKISPQNSYEIQSTDKLLIGYRFYKRDGYKVDENGRYDGWSRLFDQWIPLNSPGIQPKLAFEVGQGNLNFVKFLIEEKSKARSLTINKQFNNQFLIHNACENGKVEIAEYLLQNQICQVNTRDMYDRTPLILAIINNQLDMIELLFKFRTNFDLNCKDEITIQALRNNQIGIDHAKKRNKMKNPQII